MTATFFVFDIFQTDLQIYVSAIICELKKPSHLGFEKLYENRSGIAHYYF